MVAQCGRSASETQRALAKSAVEGLEDVREILAAMNLDKWRTRHPAKEC